MKRVLIFIVLKFLETSGGFAVVILSYFFGKFVSLFFNLDYTNFYLLALLGFCWFTTACAICVAIYLIARHAIPKWIKSNWRKAGELAKNKS